MRAVANWVTSHSQRFGDQMPTRSPFARPSARKPAASASTVSESSLQVKRLSWSTKTAASSVPYLLTVSESSAGIVCCSSGTVRSPETCALPSTGATNVAPLLGRRPRRLVAFFNSSRLIGIAVSSAGDRVYQPAGVVEIPLMVLERNPSPLRGGCRAKRGGWGRFMPRTAATTPPVHPPSAAVHPPLKGEGLRLPSSRRCRAKLLHPQRRGSSAMQLGRPASAG